jgi:hypothetical protein
MNPVKRLILNRNLFAVRSLSIKATSPLSAASTLTSTASLRTAQSNQIINLLRNKKAVNKLPSFRSLTTATLPLDTSSTYSNATATSEPIARSAEDSLTNPQVATYLLVIAGMVFSIVVVGGLTRLTESGLSITEWNVVGGVLPPLGAADWESEFAKYRESPEWRLWVIA